MRGDLYLGGGGSVEQEAALWAEAFPAGVAVAIWPFAHATAEGRDASIAWMRQALASRAVAQVDAWPELDGAERSLAGVDIVAIPGGNTFDLLHVLRSTGLLSLLRDHLRNGGRLYGGSAGAVLAGADIGIARTADRNDAGITDTRGLDLLGGVDVLPHYSDHQRAPARAHSRANDRAVLCLPEASGVVVSGNLLRNVGPESVELVSQDAVEVLEPGDTAVLSSVSTR